MKKVLLFFYVAFACSQTSYAQEGYYGESLNSSLYTASQVIGNSAPKSPDAAAFQKVNFVPISNYTGRANISVPIYTISAGKMSVPISLSYNSSGVKVNDMASNVGLNWSLNAGGMISKTIKGMDDFYLKDIVSSPGYNGPGGWLNRIGGTNQYEDDAEPDIFIANAPGLSTKYIFPNSAYTGYNGGFNFGIPSAKELEQRGNIINITGVTSHSSSNVGISNFTNTDITSINGVKYSFGSKETSKSYSAFKAKYDSQIAPERTIVSSYRLDRMFDASSNQAFDFEYEEYTVNFYDEIKQKGNDYNGGTDISFNATGTSWTKYPILQRLTKITFDKGTVEFIYGLNRSDNTNEKALTEVKVKDTNGNTIKHIKLAYSYFQTSLISSSSPQSKRLRLDRVYEVDASLNELPGHTFTYNTSYQMAPRGSFAHDFLGYNNGSYSLSNTNPVPNYYLTYDNSVFNKYIKISPFYNSSAILVPGNFSLESNVNYAKSYSLKKVTFPTGGVNEYEYELNTFSHEGVTRSGGGIRIKSQKLDDGDGNTQILDYTYETGSIANFPIYALVKGYLPANGITSLSQTGIGLSTFLAPQSQIEFTQGSFVGYSKVTVKNRISNGFTIYGYISPGTSSAYQNIKPTLSHTSSHAPSANWVVIKPPSLFVDRDFLRGKINHESTYDIDGNIRLEKEYTYTQKQFSTINLTYLNKSSSSPYDNCYYNNGVYKLNQNNCGGYIENISFPIARDLLTSVITKDYPVGNIVYTQGGAENVPYTFETTKKYVFDKQYPLLISESKEVLVCKSTTQGGEQDCESVQGDYDSGLSKIIEYPLLGGNTLQGNATSSLPFANELISKNRLSTPLKISFNGAKEKHVYKYFTNGVIALEKINFEARDASITESDKVTKRDNKGRVVEYRRKDGIYVARIYGYDDDNYLVAEIINSTYANAIYVLQNNLTTPFNGTFSNDTSIRTLMNELRVALPSTQIMSYTYKEMVGVSSITDARSRTIYYHYDAFNRLESVTDHDGKVVSKNSYHYKNQQ
jgi:YD repeat-containing protein